MIQPSSLLEQLELDDQLHKSIAPQLHLLNALNGENCQWQPTFGRQDYEDAFGVMIQSGRKHYKQGPAHTECIRLSALSMARLIHVLFMYNAHGANIASALHDATQEKLMAGLRKLSTALGSKSDYP